MSRWLWETKLSGDHSNAVTNWGRAGLRRGCDAHADPSSGNSHAGSNCVACAYCNTGAPDCHAGSYRACSQVRRGRAGDGLSGVHGWDPHRYASAEDIVVNGNIYNQLVEYDPLNVGQIIGDLAESWDISSDALTYTFNLRDNVKWTDGQALDADDVVFSLNRMIDNSTDPRPKAGVWRSYLVENAVAKVTRAR